MNFDTLVQIAVGLFIAGLFLTILHEKMNVKSSQDPEAEKSRSWMNVIDQQILESFSREGFQKLTKIQKISYPVISRNLNCLLVAPTGSGKTEASMIPILSLLENERARHPHLVEDNAICHRSIDLKASPIGASKPISFLMTDFLASIIALTIGSCSLSAHLF